MSIYIPAEAVSGKSKIIALNQSAEDIIKCLLMAEKGSRFIYPILRAYFITNDSYTTLNNIWNYAKKNIVYIKESAENQTVRTVPRILRNSKAITGDCKHMATFCVCSALACGIKAYFRLVSFNSNKSTPTHVYCVALIGSRKVYLDAVLNTFDTEPNNIKFVQDVKPNYN